ncbi:alkaline phosphatase family protein [Rhodocytophaga rosea]|uniref:Alkaline phosphatase family protein n=1 Tax=Rhodocytophaga rosea TaxID=2704465 RepID=A0A6C0GBZ9_9BACT|nr:alkaline phosphatase PafA [Rhodocytophaga rosea]QHT65417.1 alkaline phosphatase family protein [Rhodocytophaga rosea]
MKLTRIVIGLLVLSVHFAFSQQTNSPAAQPKLVIGIVVDQMRYDYIYRFWDKYSKNGFRRLVNEGYFCRNTNYNYLPTYTAPGHASVFTGTTPAVHGIIGNNWHVQANGASMYCTDDKTVQTVGSTSVAGQMSPANMLTTTITDELRLSSNFSSKVIGISLKDRGSILPAGHLANAAYWFDSQNGAFITSTYYMQTLPDWVEAFNKKGVAASYLSKPWTPLLAINQYTESLSDDSPYEGKYSGEQNPVFPHNLPEIFKTEGFELIRSTPFGNSIVKDFALQAIQAEKLGKGKATDFLAVSFSSTDYIGHKYGIRAIELEDTYLRLDQEIAQLLTFLDTYLGKNKVLVFLTADHAAADVPAFLSDRKVPAGIFDHSQLSGLRKFLFQQYGDSLVTRFINQQIYLNQKVIHTKNLNLKEVEQKVADYALAMTGVASTLPSYALRTGEFSYGVNRLIQMGYHAQRSGDVIVTLLPAWMEIGKTGTTHGSPYSYDTHVPLLWYGWQIKPGSTFEPVNITDIAPTLAAFLNTSFPNGCTGQPIKTLVEK